MNKFSQPFPQPFPFFATVPIGKEKVMHDE